MQNSVRAPNGCGERGESIRSIVFLNGLSVALLSTRNTERNDTGSRVEGNQETYDGGCRPETNKDLEGRGMPQGATTTEMRQKKRGEQRET